MNLKWQASKINVKPVKWLGAKSGVTLRLPCHNGRNQTGSVIPGMWAQRWSLVPSAPVSCPVEHPSLKSSITYQGQETGVCGQRSQNTSNWFFQIETRERRRRVTLTWSTYVLGNAISGSQIFRWSPIVIRDGQCKINRVCQYFSECLMNNETELSLPLLNNYIFRRWITLKLGNIILR